MLLLFWKLLKASAQILIEKLKTYRRNLGLTQEVFAEMAGLTYKYYQKIETGRVLNIQITTIDRIAKALGVPPWELLDPNKFPKGTGTYHAPDEESLKVAESRKKKPKKKRSKG